MSQTSYAEQPVGIVGNKADAGEDMVLSRVSEGVVYMGRAVVVGVDLDNNCKAPAATGEISDTTQFLGVAIRSHAIVSSSSGDASYPDGSAVSIMSKGRVFVSPNEAVVPTDAVFCYHTGANAGRFRTDADGGNATAVAGARWRSSCGANGIAVLELDV